MCGMAICICTLVVWLTICLEVKGQRHRAMILHSKQLLHARWMIQEGHLPMYTPIPPPRHTCMCVRAHTQALSIITGLKLFLHKSISPLISVVPFKVGCLRLHRASLVIVPYLKHFANCTVCTVCKYVPLFCLNCGDICISSPVITCKRNSGPLSRLSWRSCRVLIWFTLCFSLSS